MARVRGYDADPDHAAGAPSVARCARRAGALARRARGGGRDRPERGDHVRLQWSPGDLAAAGSPGGQGGGPAQPDERGAVRDAHEPLARALADGPAGPAAHGERDARLFTVGPLFLGSSSDLPEERLAFTAPPRGRPRGVADATAGRRRLGRQGDRRGDDAETAAARGDAPPHEHRGDASRAPWHPRGAAWIEVGGKRVGSLGPLHPDAIEAFLRSERAWWWSEFDLEALFAVAPRLARFVPLPRFPASARSLAAVGPRRRGCRRRRARGAARPRATSLEDVALFDRFVGAMCPRRARQPCSACGLPRARSARADRRRRSRCPSCAAWSRRFENVGASPRGAS